MTTGPEDRLNDPAHSPEIHLWTSVVQQSLIDATSPTPSRERDEARRWWSEPSWDFNFVCDLAGLDPFAARLKASLLARKGWEVSERWRASLRDNAAPARVLERPSNARVVSRRFFREVAERRPRAPPSSTVARRRRRA
jgi:hypothetical protein